MDALFIEVTDEDGVCQITLDRPQRLNALTFEIYRALADRFAALRAEAHVHSVVITGSGRAFCSGGDVRDIISRLVDQSAEEVLTFTRMTGELIANMRKLEKPIVAAINGTAAGAGAVIALAADLRVFSQESSIAFLFTKVGLTGADMGAGYLLPRAIGQARAAELLLLGDTIDAATAERYGLANRVVAPERCLSTAMDLARRLAKGPLDALATTKRLLDAEWTLPLEEAIEAEAQAQAVHLKQPDHREYRDAFTAKRAARFSGESAAEERRADGRSS
jgi:enoyl-CoA hydratase/carnithine racemase